MTAWRLTDDPILIVRPDGPLRAGDFSEMADAVETSVIQGKSIRGLLIDAPAFPGWADFAAIRSHFEFVRDHHRLIPRVAIVTDDRMLSALPQLGRHFTSADLRRFGAGESETALDWLRSPIPDRDRALRHAWFPRDRIIWVALEGRISSDEYRAFAAWVETILAETSPVSFLVDIGRLEGVEPRAVLADLKFGLRHLKDFRKIALLGDETWVSRAAAFPNPFPVKIKGFQPGGEEAAWGWLTEGA